MDPTDSIIDKSRLTKRKWPQSLKITGSKWPKAMPGMALGLPVAQEAPIEFTNFNIKEAGHSANSYYNDGVEKLKTEN